ncbi:type IV secretion system protein VirB10 [Methylovirgula sp. 4M-Z18]|uniref:type IV secretion system protein VirB10 n=1 Tax=Methylovirgula sp. 4M-Z18 TaxID=2293567 RepID=UPI000E2F84FC|nr:type IV secretion system protein VirB10 [Methylovirgula sp. 4M-Z18]RFB76675.1 TrbI/VirB10 family protein [Methylovirgula sp. 4M-Z18]
MSQDNDTLDGAIPPANPSVSLEGGRGRSAQGRQVVASVFLIAALGGTIAAGYYLFFKRKPEQVQAAGQVRNGLAARTFQLPPQAPPPVPPPQQPPAAPPVQAAALASQVVPVTARPVPIIVDKSASDMMVSVPNRPAAAPADQQAATEGSQSGLGALLVSTSTPGRAAQMIGNRNFILAKGSFINCSLNTAINSSVAGMTSCTVTNDVFSDNGKFVLIERGSTLTGEYQANLHVGDERLFVLWNRIKTATGVVVSLDSPGTDRLGNSGLPGYVDNHYFKRFGAAVLLSMFTTGEQIGQNAVQTAMQSKNGNNTNNTTNISTGAPDSLITNALNATINIPPTLTKNQGDTVGIFVARDLDFSTVYTSKASPWTVPR